MKHTSFLFFYFASQHLLPCLWAQDLETTYTRLYFWFFTFQRLETLPNLVKSCEALCCDVVGMYRIRSRRLILDRVQPPAKWMFRNKSLMSVSWLIKWEARLDESHLSSSSEFLDHILKNQSCLEHVVSFCLKWT